MDLLFLEKEYIEKCLNNILLVDKYKNLTQQLNMMSVVSRTFTGAGFLTNLSIEKSLNIPLIIKDGYIKESSFFIDFDHTLGGFIKIYVSDNYIKSIDFITIESKDYIKVIQNIDSFKF